MNISRYELRQAWGSTLGWMTAIILFTSLYLSVYPAFSNDVEQLRQTFANLPPAMQQVMGIGSMDIFSFLGFFGNIFPMITLVGGIMALIIGLGSLSKEQRFKTSEFILTKPRTRSNIFLQKILVAVLILAITQVVAAGVSWLIAYSMGVEDLSGRHFMMFWGAFALIQYWLFALGLLISQVVRRLKSIIAPAMGIGFGLFLLSTLGAILGDDMMRWLTPFRFIDYGQIVEQGTYDMPHVYYALGGIGLCLVLSYLIYTRKDVASTI